MAYIPHWRGEVMWQRVVEGPKRMKGFSWVLKKGKERKEIEKKEKKEKGGD